MKHKKPLLALATFGIFASAGIFNNYNVSAFSNYFTEMGEDNPESSHYLPDTVVNRINIECVDGAVDYKVSQDYDASRYTWFRADSNCTDITFDLNGKTIEQGAITIPHGAVIKLTDSVGTGSLKNTENFELYDGYNSLISNMINIRIDYGEAPFGAVGKIVFESGSYQGNVSRSSSANEEPIEIKGGTFYGQISSGGNMVISGGAFSEEPDNQYITEGYEVHTENGKYVVTQKTSQETEPEADQKFVLTNFFQYMYVGQTNDAYISPATIARTANVTSSDESIVGVSCEDSTKLLGQMMVESEDIISKACTITAKKAGKAVLSYTTDYGYEGDIAVHVVDIDATSYGNDADKAKYDLTARFLSAYVADPVEHVWYTTAPSAVDSDYGTYLENLKKTFAGLVSAIDAGHKIKLELNVENSTLSKEEKALIEGKNVAAVYAVEGSISDVTDKKTVVEEWRSGISSFPLPEILKNRIRTVQIAAFVKIQQAADAGVENHVNLIEATIKDGRVYVSPEGRISLYNNKFAILYDGSVINSDGTTDDVPAVPKTGHEEDLSKEGKSIFMILGVSAAILLIASAITAYGIHRKKALNKVRF